MHSEILKRETIENREKDWLAPYAMRSCESLGRKHPEEEHPYRTVYQRDKDRIIYSTAFRRLEYKTQVFVNHEGDYYRTRLTHTIEVAQIARTIARALRLNEDLVEAISLAHDLGHTPFGHAGEDTLSEILREHGGFDHNTHGLRVVDHLEKRYPAFNGLNLTEEVRRGIIRHSTPFDEKRTGESYIPGPLLLEIQAVDIADEIAYDNHDLDDGLKSGLLNEKDFAGIELWEGSAKYISDNMPGLDAEKKRTNTVRYLINLQVSDLIEATLSNLKELNIKSVDDLEGPNGKVVDFSEKMNAMRSPFRGLMMDKLYNHYRVLRMSRKASRFLKSLFDIYDDDPRQLPPQAAGNIEKYGKYQVIKDYMAGMTDRYALDQYKKFFEPYERV
ncbi:MAG: deoxyguanosinetriphosphate triphosphohydrolase [Candidatus Omnitrophica bacterium]|nr:deoxyguanosinetriphosphate triphosphohydrolase [Candidatus Omnitrophota bacterium]